MAIINIYRILAGILILYNSENPYELFSVGCQLELEGKIKEAIEYYKKANELDSLALEIYLSTASAYYKLRKFDKGIDFAMRGLRLIPNNFQLYLIIAAGNIGKGDLKKAIQFYTKTLEIEPKNIENYLAIATLYEGLEDFKSAKEKLRDIPEEFKNAEVYNRLGTITGKMNDHKGAIEYYRKAFSLDTTNTTALLGIGTGFDIIGIKDSSICYYERILVYDSSLNVCKRLIDLYSDTDAYENLIGMAKWILSIDYYDAAVRRSLGYALYKKGAMTEAMNEFLIASNLDPHDTYSRFYIARIYLEDGKYDESQRAINEAILINPDFIELWVYLGFISIDKKDYRTATYAFTEAAYRGADLAQIFYLHGVVAEMRHQYEDAYYFYKKSASKDPKYLSTLEALANLCERINKKEEAFETFNKIITLDTTSAVALNYVGYTYAERNESLGYALELINRALAIEANNGYYIDSRGWVFYQMQQYEAALVELKRAAELVEDAVILEHLGDAYLKLKEPMKAIESYQRALRIEPNNKNLMEKLQGIKAITDK